MFAHKLVNKDVVATVAVKDMAVARKFYEDKLGLKQQDPSNDDVATYKAGDTSLFVYKSDYAGGYGATVATWAVGDDLEDIVEDLADRGVEFEHYHDMPDTEIKGDIHYAGDMKMAWFKDPDGSIIALVNG